VAPIPVGSAPASAAALGTRLGHAFRDTALLEHALTHRSFVNEWPAARDNGPLAFLGDAVLSLVIAERLWREHPDGPVGVLTPERAAVVSGVTLARWAEAIDLGAHLRLGRGEQASGGAAKASLLANALEAVLAVIYVEGGLEAAGRAIARLDEADHAVPGGAAGAG
jgi:ribonuclease-3